MPAIVEGIVDEGWLKANVANSNGDLVEGAEISLYGQVVHRRRLSSKLLFYDILLTPGPATPGVTSSAKETSSSEMDSVKQAEQGVELMVKASGRTQGRMPLSEVQRLRLDVKLGDIVRAYGVRELCMSSGAPVLHCTRVEVATPWSSLRTGNEQFVPQPHTFWRIPEGTAAAPESVTSSAPGSLAKKQPLSSLAYNSTTSGPAPKNMEPRAARDAQGVLTSDASATPTAITPQGSSGSSSDLQLATSTNLANPASNGSARHSAFCKYYVNTGRCFYGDQCRFVHSVSTTEASNTSPNSTDDTSTTKANMKKARAMWVQERYDKRREIATMKGDPHASTSSTKSHRARVFVDWL
eukprot:CAMPEP_0198227504 /NCGR_PEP_ID=MMETSP1445-20131203/109489_1 /TAXON_ID=36898 /ORGANISM="Pyramimonas sp., Strain CCMP2087" /LENGTH=353 /DNA_ID=CAMNT_0043907583 /DNA_START=273 /DNA_END=1331 /DNA_ORIENTATION=+